MKKYYIFNMNKEGLLIPFLDEMTSSFLVEHVQSYSPRTGSFVLDSSFHFDLEKSLREFSRNNNVNVTLLETYKVNEFNIALLRDTYAAFPNMVIYPSDCLFRQFGFGDFSSLPLLKEEFSHVEREILETVGTYLISGMDGLATAKALDIHRNTFNYRIKKWIEDTNLDPRDYHNALLLEIYFQFSR